jgi:signal transduction histidine kinase
VKKAGILFVLAVLAPSLVLAWVALRSLRDQELILAEQRDLLYEELAESRVKDVFETVSAQQSLFAQKVETLRGKLSSEELETRFDRHIAQLTPIAKTGFVVTMDGRMLSPSLLGTPGARRFRLQYERFLTSKETAQVYWEGPKGPVNLTKLDSESAKGMGKGTPQSARTEFRDLVGDAAQGTVARFVEDELRLIFWYRPPQQPEHVYGIEVNLEKLAELLTGVADLGTKQAAAEVCVALLDENFRPVARSHSGFETDWRQPFEAVEIGDLLPHWKVAVYLLNPAELGRTAKVLRVALSLLIAVAVLSIVGGAWLVFRDLKREVEDARLRSDFVSNVSHELKTPLTSIRIFTELLAEGRAGDPVRAKEYLRIIVSETARLTRLINNVLDFARLEKGEKRYRLQDRDLVEVIRQAVESYRPHLERSGFQVELKLPMEPVRVEGDDDALAQVMLNLLSNAEKYSTEQKSVSVSLAVDRERRARLSVEDRGRGVPSGFEKKIFEQFVRAHDSLADAVPGAGLGLTLARQIVRAHRGEIWYEPREGGGSRFLVELPIKTDESDHVRNRDRH